MIHETKTPSGLTITFEDGEPDENGKSKRRCYLVDGEKLVSVTTVLGCLEKPGLMYASEKLAIAGAIELAAEGELPTTVDGALSRLKSRDLRFFQQWGRKATRGTVAHEDLVRLAVGEEEPRDLSEFTPDQRGFIRGVSAWYADERPQIDETEVMVASPKFGFAGRHDLFGRLPQRHPTAKFLLDLKTVELLPRFKDKTVRPPYPENLLQLAGYELARRESGYEPSDFQGVLRVDSTGAYDFFCTVVEIDWFLAVLSAYRAVKGLPSKPLEQLELAA